ncbi:MAG: 50S ribosomal protein L32 [Galactobacillus timonensis]|jgi:large subunit ribosomal protein L32|uniref:Large ribosomal subunit protein bL32 n=1 Tax=Stecheria intestinalis TaxID=2606630 RepID=A0A7X2NPP1_9FIRM|nr:MULTISPECIES: 50S ribosomal protein L32 [Erysipelotrichaceae]MDY3235054.1 50S ribosomal protein L32 [Erysipelotrichaceae bacterium]MDY4680994.1 50S ribosomal protein L32 [Lachnospiraceae bacterium]MCI6745553.1 50S ribosomal protein L32 [Anaerolactibacter massiliensis]MDD5880665.1 50S ribosomal protein L32 [Stecheria intestinalis]MDD6365431.1 50S ribosomal protein L32 [Stecheria intestinalis]
MAVQQRRNSKTRRDKRRTHYKLAAPTLVKCPVCGAYKQPHHACPVCGSVGDAKKTAQPAEEQA